MANDYFQFKEFVVYQGLSAMKVSTDACIQGAWAATQLEALQDKSIRILDIGSGSGLLSLMLKQKFPQSIIKAIDIDEGAFQQTQFNFENSKWKTDLSVEKINIVDYNPTNNIFDIIICNPPFFKNHLGSQHKERHIARHEDTLSKSALATHVANLLDINGSFIVLYPSNVWSEWTVEVSKTDLYLHQILQVKPNQNKAPNRTIGIYKKVKPFHIDVQELIIYEEDKNYTQRFKEILAPYYLNL